LIIGLDEAVYVRQISTVLPLTSAESVGVPTLDTDPDDPTWTSELSIGNEDTSMATGKRNLHPHPLAMLLKVSKTLLRRSAIPAEQLVRDRLTFKFSVAQEKGFLTGHGAVQPLGVFTASANGISTGRDVSTDNTTTAITADGLINAKYSLASQYLMSANLRWIFHRTAVRNIRKLKDGNGQYLWQAGLGGTPDSILEVPYIMSEYAPSTFTTGQYVGIIGDFRWYWIAESLRFELQRLDELYAATNQVGFIGRLEADGMPVLEEAFARVKLA
jgi:HK97 family phage major capsid protein